MKIVDCHTHVGRNHHIDFSAEDLLKSMDEAGIEQSLVFAGKLNDASNDWMLKEVAPHQDRLKGVAAAHPVLAKSSFDDAWVKRFLESADSEEFDGDFTAGCAAKELRRGDKFQALAKHDHHNQDEIKRIVDLYGEGKIVACKFYTGYDHYFPGDDICREYLEALHEVGCPAIFHTGDCLNSAHHAKLKYANPLHIDDVANDYPNMKFVIAHVGYPFQREAAEVCYKNTNVFADISGFVYKEFKEKDIAHFKKVIQEFVEIAGSTNKLLFGTDAPISSQKSYIDVVTNHIDYAEPPIWDNYKKVFNL